MRQLAEERQFQRFYEQALSTPRFVPSEREPIAPYDSARCILHAALWSDLHISELLMQRTLTVLSCADDLADAACPPDALLIAGDLGDNGKEKERRLLRQTLAGVGGSLVVLPATGNHDIRLRRFAETRRDFCAFCKAVNPALRPEHLYYRAEVNGVPVFVLGSERTVFEAAALSGQQLCWLYNGLRETAGKGRPVFVMLHQPLRDTHGLPATWDSPVGDGGHVGEQSGELRKILDRFPDVFLLTGHLHRGYRLHTFEEVGNIHAVNVPSLGDRNKDSAYANAGLGFLVEVYPEKVVFRARDFFHGRYVGEWERTYALQSAGKETK